MAYYRLRGNISVKQYLFLKDDLSRIYSVIYVSIFLLLGNLVGSKTVQYLTTGGLLLSFLGSLYVFVKTGFSQDVFIYDLGTWVQAGFLHVSGHFYLIR